MILLLVADQVLKFWIKTTFPLHHEQAVFGSWFFLRFIENEGMAFGMKLGGEYGKLALSLFRIAAVAAIIWWLYRVTRKGAGNLLIVCISLVLAGALGNIIDSAFYGLVFSESTMMQTAEFLPVEGGYGTFLHGKVVDMFYFPLIESTFPSWLPFWGGESFTFFSPVFNLADASITTGVFLMILFQKRLFGPLEKEEENPPAPMNS